MVAVPADQTAVPEPVVVVEAEPVADDGEGNEDRVELVRTGLIRVWVGGKRFRLRRPFFGEFRTLRLALEDVNDEIADLVDESATAGRELTADLVEAGKMDDPDAFAAHQREARKKSRETARYLTTTAEDLRLSWLADVFDLLSLDGDPAEFPAWVIDPKLGSQIVTHWRTAPLGRG